MNRRNFLQASIGLSAISLLKLNAQAFGSNKQVGIQLYTLRDDIVKQGIETILEQVGKLGFKEVENFGYGQGKFFGKSPTEYRKILSNNGLTAVSGHYQTGRASRAGSNEGLATNWQKILDDAAEIGQKYAIIAFLPPTERKLEDYKHLIDLLNKAEEPTKKAGLKVGYHNHDFEFTQQLEGQKPYDLLLQHTSVAMEMDLYWVTKSGEKPIDYFAKYPGRFPLWHLKDMANTPEQEFAEVGTGTINFANLFQHAKQAGLIHYFVEQDVCKRPPMESIKISIDNIRKAQWG